MLDKKNLDWLNRKRICYIQYPITDKPTESYPWGWYYRCGTYQCYELFRSKAKINSLRSFKWHLYVLLYINDGITFDEFKNLVHFLAVKENNFVSISLSVSLLDKLVNEMHGNEIKLAPKNKLRKVIFKIGSGLEVHEKLSIVGKLIGRSKKISEQAIYSCMLDINALDKKITVTLLAKLLCCTTKTVHRNLTDQLIKEKNTLNESL
jgi:hypothetical protein